MSSFVGALEKHGENPNRVSDPSFDQPGLAEAQAVLLDLARVFSASPANPSDALPPLAFQERLPATDAHELNMEAKYRALLEQIPAVVFMAYLDRGISEAYVSPEIESVLGYSRENGWKIPFAGTTAFIPRTSIAGAWKQRRCFSPASRCARLTG